MCVISLSFIVLLLWNFKENVFCNSLMSKANYYIPKISWDSPVLFPFWIQLNMFPH